MNLKQEKRYVKKRIEGIEGAISVHQSAIAFGRLCEVEIKCRQEFIQELMVDLEAYRYYLNYLNSQVK
jgi:Ni,Fe-hydrogenase III large subunit